MLYDIIINEQQYERTGKITLELIHKAAKSEFLYKVFHAASLRKYRKNCGSYNSKEELLKALVGEKYDYLMSKYKAAISEFAANQRYAQYFVCKTT